MTLFGMLVLFEFVYDINIIFLLEAVSVEGVRLSDFMFNIEHTLKYMRK